MRLPLHGPRQSGLEVLLAFLGRLRVPVARVLRLQVHHHQRQRADGRRVADANPPLDPPSGQTMQPVQPDQRTAGRSRAASTRRRASSGAFSSKKPTTRTRSSPVTRITSATKNRPYPSRTARRLRRCRATNKWRNAKHQKRQNQQQPQHDVEQEHDQVEAVLVRQPVSPPTTDPLHTGDGRQIHRVGPQHGGDRQHDMEHDLQPRSQDTTVSFRRAAEAFALS